MRRMVVNSLVLALVLASASLSLVQAQQAPPAQEKKPAEKGYIRRWDPQSGKAKSKLEEMLAEALKNNPDIRVAVAKVAEADAELNRTRLLVTQKVIALHHGMLSQKAAVDYAQKKYERLKQLSNQGAIDSALLEEAQQALTLAKAKQAELEAQMPALLGKAARGTEGNVTFTSDNLMSLSIDYSAGIAKGNTLSLFRVIPHQAEGPMADKIRKALETPVKVDYKDAKLSEILKDLQKTAPGLSFRDFSGHGNHSRTLQFEEALPVSAILQAIGDYFELSFVVREYGILVTTPKEAPPGALTVQEFLRQGKTPAEKK
jgi:hypothetical protein